MILNNEQQSVLYELLAKSKLCKNEDARRALLYKIGDDPDNHELKGPVRVFGTILIGDLVEQRKISVLKELIKAIEEVLSEDTKAIKQIYELQRAVSQRAVHIITSTKGGVGKTLSALAASLDYLDNGGMRGVLCLDNNSMNQDMFRILSNFKNGENRDLTSRNRDFLWKQARIADHVHVLRPNLPYRINGGAHYFWDSILHLIDAYDNTQPDFISDYDVIVDTNLHIANLTFGEAFVDELSVDARKTLPSWFQFPIDNMISEIIEKTNGTIYVWLFWTWAAFQNPEFDAIKSAILSLESNFGTDVRIVHVLNPSALTQPEIVFPPTVKDMEKQLETLYKQLQFWKSKKKKPQSITQIKYLRALINNLHKAIKQSATFTNSTVPGLANIASLKDTLPPLPFFIDNESQSESEENINNKSFFSEFVSVFRSEDLLRSELLSIKDDNEETPHLTDEDDEDDEDDDTEDDILRLKQELDVTRQKQIFVELHTKIKDSLNGRPANILPITTHDVSLRGYTERFARQKPENFAELRKDLQNIIADISRFLEHV